MKKVISIILWMMGSFFFLFSFCLLVICLFSLPKPKTFAVARNLFKILIRIMGIKLVVKGQKNIDADKTYIMMGNHQSLFDLFVIPAAVPLCFTGVEAAYHFSIPVWGYLIRKWGCIPIERNNLKSAMKSLEKARHILLTGMNLCILPEGHRTLTGKMGEFKKGPFHLAKSVGADILPFGVNGLFDFHPKGCLELNPGQVTVKIGRPIPYKEINAISVDEIRQLCFEKITHLSSDGLAKTPFKAPDA
ncbi:MAG: 1-acyl-sn-glycerol-3-phosphate acyltransferase [Desulfobacula sp.]|nr:1-acyl-sn-glycerol-3-phosphate acyltransferase [Desulfobacula sp.]